MITSSDWTSYVSWVLSPKPLAVHSAFIIVLPVPTGAYNYPILSPLKVLTNKRRPLPVVKEERRPCPKTTTVGGCHRQRGVPPASRLASLWLFAKKLQRPTKKLLVTSSFKDLLKTFLFLVVRPGATSSILLLLVAMPFVPSSVLAPTPPRGRARSRARRS